MEFSSRTAEKFGKPLNQKAVVAVKDVHRFWVDISVGIKQNTLSVALNHASLAHKYREHSRQKLKSAGIFLAAMGLAGLFIKWPFGVAAIVLGCLVFYAAKKSQDQTSRRFASQLAEDLADPSKTEAMETLASLYISGILTLESDTGKAHWPQYPSDVFTGETRFIAY